MDFCCSPTPLDTPGLLKSTFFLMEREKNHSQFPNCFVPAEYYMGGPINIDPPELGVLPPRDLKLWPPTNLQLWVFISCGEMMCLSLPRSLPGVYQHYCLLIQSFFYNMSVNIELTNLIYLLHYCSTSQIKKKCNSVLSYQILNLSFLKNKK